MSPATEESMLFRLSTYPSLLDFDVIKCLIIHDGAQELAWRLPGMHALLVFRLSKNKLCLATEHIKEFKKFLWRFQTEFLTLNFRINHENEFL